MCNSKQLKSARGPERVTKTPCFSLKADLHFNSLDWFSLRFVLDLHGKCSWDDKPHKLSHIPEMLPRCCAPASQQDGGLWLLSCWLVLKIEGPSCDRLCEHSQWLAGEGSVRAALRHSPQGLWTWSERAVDLTAGLLGCCYSSPLLHLKDFPLLDDNCGMFSSQGEEGNFPSYSCNHSMIEG